MTWIRVAPLLFLVILVLPASAKGAPTDRWVGTDKWMHGAMSASIAQLTFLTTDALSPEEQRSYLPVTVAVGGTFLIGLGKEGMDAMNGGTFSGKDLLWDLGGTLLGTGISWLMVFLLTQ